MKVDFYLLGKKGFVALTSFLEKNGSKGVGIVVAARDSGNEDDHFDEIKKMCSIYQIDFFERGTEQNRISSEFKYTFAIGWRWLILDSSRLVVFHDSLLPKYRGFSPLVNMLINREPEIGVTALIASDEYDKGDIICQKSVSISYPIKIQSAIELIAPVYSELVLEVYGQLLEREQLHVTQQDESLATYSLWRDEDDYLIDWRQSSEDIKRFCDAVGYPYKGACSYVRGRKIRVNDAAVVVDVVVEMRSENLGKIIFMDAGTPIVVCGVGLLRINNYNFENIENGESGKINFRSKFESAKR